jgi:hypothetical protein
MHHLNKGMGLSNKVNNTSPNSPKSGAASTANETTVAENHTIANTTMNATNTASAKDSAGNETGNSTTMAKNGTGLMDANSTDANLTVASKSSANNSLGTEMLFKSNDVLELP